MAKNTITGIEEYMMLIEKSISDGTGAFSRVEAQTNGNFYLANSAATQQRENSQQRVCKQYGSCKNW